MSVVLTLRQKYEVKGRTKKTEPPQRLEEQKSAACCSVHPSKQFSDLFTICLSLAVTESATVRMAAMMNVGKHFLISKSNLVECTWNLPSISMHLSKVRNYADILKEAVTSHVQHQPYQPLFNSV
ncbi:hypothetical protein T10_12221 [Trichinella papuae]|uniref:Uncharacterized protein n=1 Tax=Trichinella papuae TaxID=268474 RepID=A0A0V1N0D8_9BILA|nr:hypothetical protein T10_12221 [Trichinella papuae]